jgi:hypothetical protein
MEGEKVEEKGISIQSSFEHLLLGIKYNVHMRDGEEIVIYLPRGVYEKLAFELSQVQRFTEHKKSPGFSHEILLFNTFRIRPEHELEYLERTIYQIRKMVA